MNYVFVIKKLREGRRIFKDSIDLVVIGKDNSSSIILALI